MTEPSASEAGSEHRWIVDAIENGVARLEPADGEPIMLPAWLLPADAAAGDVVRAQVTVASDRATLALTRDIDDMRITLEQSAEQLAGQPVGESSGDIEL